MDTINANPRLRNTILVLAIILIAFVAVKIIREVKEISYVGQPQMVNNQISVTGKGEVLAKPDIASFDFTVSEEASNVADAQSKATEKMNSILDYLKKSGIEDRDVKTTSYNVYPRYDYLTSSSYYPSGRQVLAAYVVSQTVTVKVRAMEKAGTLLTGIGEFGATNVSGLMFSVDAQDKLMLDARDKAITDARDQAKKLANALGVSLGSITSFYESSPYQPMYYGKDMMMSANGSARPESAPSLPSGESKIISNVTITYEIK